MSRPGAHVSRFTAHRDGMPHDGLAVRAGALHASCRGCERRGSEVGGMELRHVVPRWRWQAWAVVLVLASIAAGVLFDALFGRIIPLRPEAIRDRLDDLGPRAPLAFVLLMATAVVV